MRKQHDSEVRTKPQHKRIKWVEPGLVDLSRARERARGLCIGGSGDFDCSPVGTGAVICTAGTGG